MKSYDEVISLGYNCEISFRIRDYYGKLCSWPFSWTYILDRDAFISALNNLDEVFQGEVHICQDDRVNSMIECDKYHICFHPRGEYVSIDGTIPIAIFPQAVAELRQRVKYLVEKFETAMSDGEKNYIFFIGLTDNGKTCDKEFIVNLENALNHICLKQNYTLVVVVPKKRYSKELEQLNTDKVKIRTIKYFGKQKCNDISTDMFGWGRIFREFLGDDNIWSFYRRINSHRLKRIISAIGRRIVRIMGKK